MDTESKIESPKGGGFPLGLLVAAVVYVALRAAILVTGFDAVAMTNYELFPMGTLPKAMSLGGTYPLHLYYDNAAGQLVTGLLAKLSYALFGETYLALKLVPATLGFLALIVLWNLSNLLWGRRAAAVVALLFAVGPTELATKYSLFASGNHFENLFFISLALYAHYRLQAAGPGSRRRWLVAAGFTGGLALFVFLGAIIPVGLVVLAHLGIRGWRDALLDLRAWLPGFLVGIAPLVLVNAFSGARGGGFLQAKFGKPGSAEGPRVLERMETFVTKDVFEAGFHNSWLGIDWRWPSAVLLGVFALAWLAALLPALGGVLRALRGAFSWERSPEAQARTARSLELAPFVFLGPLAALAFGLSDLRIDRWPAPLEVAGFRYFLPIFLTGTLLVGALVGRAPGPLRWPALVIAVAAGSTGLWNLRYVHVDQPRPGLGAAYPGFNFVQAARGLLGARNNLDQATRIEYADSFPDYFRAQLYRGMGNQIAQHQLVFGGGAKRGGTNQMVASSTLDLGAIVEGYPSEMHTALAYGAGEGLRALALSTKPGFEALAPHLGRLVERGGPLDLLAVEGSAFQGGHPPILSRSGFFLGRNLLLMSMVDPAVRPTLARGFGRMTGFLLARELPGEEPIALKATRSIAPDLRASFDAGLGQGLVEGREDPRWIAAVDNLSPERAQRVRAAFDAALAAVAK